jgi:hypothetical protein
MSLQLSFGQFNGVDTLVEFFIIIVSLIISYYSHKIDKLVQEKSYKFFAWGFLSIAVAFVFKVISNITILNKVTVEKANFIFTFFANLQWAEIIQFISFVLYKVFFILGFLILFFIITKTEKKEKMFLFIYFGVITILFSIYINFIFHLTLVMILTLLTIHFYENYQRIKNRNSFLVFMAFLIILISHIFFIFVNIGSIFYLFGEIALLIAFTTLLVNHIGLKHEKTNKARSDKRPFVNFKRK